MDPPKADNLPVRHDQDAAQQSSLASEATRKPSDEKQHGRHVDVQDESLDELPSSAAHDDDDITYLTGARFWMVSFLIAIMFFLVQVEISIVTTSLVAISRELGGFDIAGWILSSYLLGYVAVVVIMAKLSDIFGRRWTYIWCIVIFVIFSAGCSAAMTMPQLIILRAFQGMGGGGSYALSMIMIVEIVPPHKYGNQIAYTGLAIVVAMVGGPIIGGAISSNTTWRWIFIFNVPVGAIALLLAYFGIPNGFPYHGRPVIPKTPTLAEAMARADLVGCLLVLLATVSFTAAFQEADSRFAWDSAYVIVLLISSILLWAALLWWERRVTIANGIREPVLPWRLLTSRAMMGILLGIVLLGGPLTVTDLQLPQRFQLVNGLSALDAGIRLVPFGAAVPVGTIASSNVLSKLQVPALYVTMVGGLLQVVGFALLGTLEASSSIPPANYGYQVIAGVGCGVSFQTLFLAIPFVVENRDKAVALGSANQFRAMGSAIMIAVTTSVFNGHVYSEFRHLGVSDPSSHIGVEGDSNLDVTPEMLEMQRHILAEGYNRQMLVLCGCGAAQVFAALLMWRKKPIRVA